MSWIFLELTVATTPVANLPPVSTTLVKLVAKFAAGVVDTGGKIATGVVATVNSKNIQLMTQSL
jgi:hypothetical protein